MNTQELLRLARWITLRGHRAYIAGAVVVVEVAWVQGTDFGFQFFEVRNPAQARVVLGY